jgi:hypothetical protein
MTEPRTAVVYAATWVSAPPPVPDTEREGYAVAWVDPDAGGHRVQAYVDSHGVPEPGASGAVRFDDDLGVSVFTESGGEA